MLNFYISKLRASGIDNAAREVRLLLAFVLDQPYEYVLFETDIFLTPEQKEKLEQLVQRRVKQEPLSKIIGRKEFWSLTFRVTEHTLDPRPDSETLIEAVLKAFSDHQKPYHIIDFGTGTGCLILSLLTEYPNAIGVGVDICPHALNVAKENANTLHLNHRCSFVQSCWAENIKGTFDIIVSNPPYIEPNAALPDSVKLYDPPLALFAENSGLRCYEELLGSIHPLCHKKTKIFLEIGQGQEHDVARIAEKYGFLLEHTYPDLAGINRVLVVSPTP